MASDMRFVTRTDAEKFIEHYLHSAAWEGERLIVSFDREALIAALVEGIEPVAAPSAPRVPRRPRVPPEPAWWCCKADYPDHVESCSNYVAPRVPEGDSESNSNREVDCDE